MINTGVLPTAREKEVPEATAQESVPTEERLQQNKDDFFLSIASNPDTFQDDNSKKDLQMYLKESGHSLGKTGEQKDGVDGVIGNKTINAIKTEMQSIFTRLGMSPEEAKQKKQEYVKRESPIEMLDTDPNKPIPSHMVRDSGHYFTGSRAIKEIEKTEGKLSPMEARVAELEGYVDTYYEDSKGIVTKGVGQTGKYMDMTFKESFKVHEDDTKRLIPGYEELPEKVKAELVQSTYRGDLQQSPTARRLFNEGKFKEAAQEFLNNDEYRKERKKFRSGIAKRMEAVASAMNSLA